MAYQVSSERFETLTEEALKGIPKKFMRYFKNVSIIVEYYPSRYDCKTTSLPRYQLLGLFRGIDYPRQGGVFDIPSPLPDTIALYQRNIEAVCDSEEDLVYEIRATLVHEVGHYFGLSEEDLAEYE